MTILHIQLTHTEYIIDQQCPTKTENIAGQNKREFISDQAFVLLQSSNPKPAQSNLLLSQFASMAVKRFETPKFSTLYP